MYSKLYNTIKASLTNIITFDRAISQKDDDAINKARICYYDWEKNVLSFKEFKNKMVQKFPESEELIQKLDNEFPEELVAKVKEETPVLAETTPESKVEEAAPAAEEKALEAAPEAKAEEPAKEEAATEAKADEAQSDDKAGEDTEEEKKKDE